LLEKWDLKWSSISASGIGRERCDMSFPVLDTIATGQRIRELRIQKHLRVEDVSEYMGFESVQAVYKWQRGETMPTVDNLYALSSLFETPIDDILRGSEDAERN
jgi:DNA-binding transcriptional regulator YiaG